MKIKKKEILTTNQEELNSKIKELKNELIKINAQIATGTMLKSPGQPRLIKKTIARIQTIRHK